MLRRTLLLTAVSVMLAAPGAALSQTAELGVDFDWQGVPACSATTPAFKLTGIPAGTKFLRFKMVDLDVPTYPHGGGTIDYAGGDSVERGAFSYTGPCPPFGSHRYEFTVEALGADKSTVLARGKAMRPFPPN